MAVDALVKPLLPLPLFRGLTAAQLHEISRRTERIVYRPGDMIAAENTESSGAIIIVSGHCIRLEGKSKDARGELLPEGSMIAELAMLVEVVHSATIVAQTVVKALSLPRERMHELMQQNPALAAHFSSVMIKRLREIADELSAIDLRLEGLILSPPLPAIASQSNSVSHASLN